MAEDHELCTYYRFHKHKIILFLAAMRTYADELKAAGYRVQYFSWMIVPSERKAMSKSWRHFLSR
jgi:deoxyribodipyrimidine photolyase-like uncharacterized protein